MKAFAEIEENQDGRGGYVSAKTEPEVEKKFESLAERYIKSGTKREKYLAIQIEADKDDWSMNDDIIRAGGKDSFLRIAWTIVERIELGAEVQYKYKESHGRERHFDEGHNVAFVPWSPSRQAFLESITASLQSIADRTKAFFLSDTLVKQIDLKKTPLIGLN